MTIRWFFSAFLLAGMITNPSSANNIVAAHENSTIKKYLLPKLFLAKKSGRINYEGSCTKYGAGFPLAPSLSVHAAKNDKAFLETVRNMLSSSRAISVAEAPGIVRITVGAVNTSILETKISSLTLTPMEQYNRTLAFSALEKAPEVRSVADALRLRPFPNYVDELMVKPAPNLPHLPASFSNITVDHFLDITASTFGGVVYYGTCERKGFYSIDFAGGYQN